MERGDLGEPDLLVSQAKFWHVHILYPPNVNVTYGGHCFGSTTICHTSSNMCYNVKKHFILQWRKKCDILQWCKKCYILRWRKKHVSSNVCTSKCGKFVIYIQFLIQWRWFYPNRLVNSWDILLKLKKMLGFFSIVQVCARIAAYFCFKSRK